MANNKRHHIITTRIRRYERIAHQVSRGALPERVLYAHHKMRLIVPRLYRALAKMREGSAAYCDGCGEEIPQARREAVPGATHCVSCQAVHEMCSMERLG